MSVFCVCLNGVCCAGQENPKVGFCPLGPWVAGSFFFSYRLVLCIKLQTTLRESKFGGISEIKIFFVDMSIITRWDM